ncbi:MULTISPECIES: hypothetical protein [unclassified Caballeronia]|uniref:hypothetical protein n=1 Tax=unclassified Caballeronia TaxID=2646786 RepID=UPI002027F614|nr:MULTISPECIES: hypothetical protein [unclassified Caballeronia]MDR5764379.1 hypothetical protein [Caballeronia sp. LZ028]
MPIKNRGFCAMFTSGLSQLPKRGHLLIAATMALTGCGLFPQPSHNVTVAAPEYDSAVSARIRLLSGNGTRTASYLPNHACYGGSVEGAEWVAGDDGFFANWKYSSRSEVIGMPPSPREFMRVDGLEFKDSIREYVVAGGQPIVLSMGTSGSAGNAHWWCTPPRVTFSPVAGRDYDAFLEMRGRQCWISVRLIDGHDMDEPVAVTRAAKCADARVDTDSNSTSQ